MKDLVVSTADNPRSPLQPQLDLYGAWYYSLCQANVTLYPYIDVSDQVALFIGILFTLHLYNYHATKVKVLCQIRQEYISEWPVWRDCINN